MTPSIARPGRDYKPDLHAGKNAARIRRLEKRAAPVIVRRVISNDSAPFEPMKYAILGDDTRSEEEKLAHYTGEVPWSYLAPHFQKGSLYFVDPSLKLEEVGAAFAANRADQVRGWLSSGDLVKIEAIHTRQWQDGNTLFHALVVSPFVLCRPL